MVPRPPLTDERGFTFVELLVAVTLLVLGVFGTVALVEVATAKSFEVKRRQAATGLARQVVEASRSVSYAKLTSPALEQELQTKPGLADSNAGDAAWTIQRSRATYEVSATACSMDDPGDRLGSHTSGNFCSDPAADNPPDDNPDDYKRVTVEVTWAEGQGQKTTRQTTLVPNPSSAAGPKITSLTRSPTADPITDDNVTSIAFTGVTSTAAATVNYLVDGAVSASLVPGSGGTSSTFDWIIRDPAAGEYVLDGSYVIGAQAFDDKGLPGAVRSLPVKLNRRVPAAPDNFTATWNRDTGVADFEWFSSNEGDITGYRVYRRKAGTSTSPTVVCENDVSTTTCLDQDGPATQPQEYWLVARDLSPSGVDREGTQSPHLVVDKGDNRPNPPSQPTRSDVAGGGVQLDWQAPVASSPGYSGDGVLFYRVYRDSYALSGRYTRTASAGELSFFDSATDGLPHTYWITAVDQNYSESAAVEAVSSP